MVSADAFAAKYAGKREVWRFLTVDCKAYLPAYETVTVFHMRDLVASKRRIIKSDDVNHITVPFFEGLTIEKMYEFAETVPGVMEAFPIIQREQDKLPREYIANVIHTLVGEKFQDWVNERADARHEKL